MNMHKNARLTPRGRERIVRLVASGQTPEAVAKPQASARGPFANGLIGIAAKAWRDCRTGRPGRIGCANRRRRRPRGDRAAAPSALDRQADRRRTGVSPATVSRVLRRLGLNKLSALEPAEPVRRYERENPGELIHIDIKKLGRIVGVAIASPAIVRVRSTSLASVGSSSTSASTMLRASLSSRSWPTSEGERRRLPRGCRRLLRKPRRQGRARHDRQRLVLSLDFREACRLGLRQIRPSLTRRRPTERPSASSRQPARVGLCPGLQHSDQRTAELPLASSLQLA